MRVATPERVRAVSIQQVGAKMDAQTRFQRFLRVALIPLFVLAIAVPTVIAQTLTGQLSGTVVDSSDAVLPGATVTLVNELSGDQRTTVTNEAGNFVFAA